MIIFCYYINNYLKSMSQKKTSNNYVNNTSIGNSLNDTNEQQNNFEDENDEKKKEIWVNSIKADGGAYKGCPKNDYCQHFVDTGERPQNFIRDYEEEKRFLDYPKLNELIKRKNEVLQKRATPPQWLKADLRTLDFSNLGKFDVILVDPPLEEYSRRIQGLGIDTSNLAPWTYEDIADLRIDLLADSCCFLFLWVGSSEGLDKGRMLLKKWNFRRCEDIVWIKTNKHNFKRKYYNDKEDTLLQHTKEHCLVGIKGAVKRGIDGHFIHANIDTDVIVSEEPPIGSTEKPQELYRIIERFCMGRKRIELFGEDHNIRPGWITIGKSLSSSNCDLEKYNNFFKGELCYPDVQGYEGGRFVGCTQEIENLRPRSPVRNPIIPKIQPMQMMYGYPMGLGMYGFNMMGSNMMWNNMSNPNGLTPQSSSDLSRMNSMQFNNIQVNNANSYNSSFEYSSNLGTGINYNSYPGEKVNLVKNSNNFNQNC